MSIVFSELVQQVRDYLDSQNWKYSINDSITLSFNIDCLLEECDICIRFISYNDIAFSVHISATCPLTVPKKRENSIIELITRANYGMSDGYFSYKAPESKSEQGVIAYHSWLYCRDCLPDLNDVESSVDFPMRMMEKYGDAIFNVLNHNSNPEEEIHQVEE